MRIRLVQDAGRTIKSVSLKQHAVCHEKTMSSIVVVRLYRKGVRRNRLNINTGKPTMNRKSVIALIFIEDND